MSDAGPPAWPSKALRAAQKSRVGGCITKVKENSRKSERFSCVVQQLLMKSNLPFPLAHRILKELLFCCIIRALKCGSHPQT